MPRAKRLRDTTLSDRLGFDRGLGVEDEQRAARKRADALKMVRRARDALVGAEHWIYDWGNGHLVYSPIVRETELSQRDSTVSPEGQNSLRRETEQPSEPEREPEKEPCRDGDVSAAIARAIRLRSIGSVVSDLIVIEDGDDRVVLQAPNDGVRSFAMSNIGDDLQRALGRPVDIIVGGDADGSPG